MLGSNKYKVNGFVDISNERLRSLVTFYLPLIGPKALSLFEYFALNETTFEFKELSDLLNILNMSIDEFEESIIKLNEYKLLSTFKKDNEDQYIFVLNNPKDRNEFIEDNILVRNFILATSGKYYQDLLSRINKSDDNYYGYQNVSKKMDLSLLNNWKQEDEKYLDKQVDNDYNFNTIFDINVLLKDVSPFLFPMKYRTKENLKEIATLADLYNISYNKMRNYISKSIKTAEDNIDLNVLRKLCMASLVEYKKTNENEFNVPNIIYLMNLQDGKEVSPYDKSVIYNLAHDYKLSTPVINVLLRHALKQCDNRLIEKYIYPIASDLHRNNINTSQEALNRLDKYANRKVNQEDIIPVYDTKNNPDLDKERLKEILSRRKRNE